MDYGLVYHEEGYGLSYLLVGCGLVCLGVDYDEEDCELVYPLADCALVYLVVEKNDLVYLLEVDFE